VEDERGVRNFIRQQISLISLIKTRVPENFSGTRFLFRAGRAAKKSVHPVVAICSASGGCLV
jgi:hypothetical protein